MRTLAPHPTIEVHNNQLMTGMIRYIYIIRAHIHGWLKSCDCLSNLSLCVIGHLLTDYLQRLRRDTENQPAALPERTERPP